MAKSKLEYIWLDGYKPTQSLRSKTKIESNFSGKLEDLEGRAVLYSTKVKNYFEEIRYSVDKLELIIDDDEWPLPKYRELLLIK